MKVLAGRYLVGLATGVVVIAVVSGIVLLGPPTEERARRLDERRVEDLRGITRAIDLYWTRQGGLPSSLDELLRESGVSVNPRDPVTAQPYGYRVDGKTYELCAEFQRDSVEQFPLPVPDGFERTREFWFHDAGKRCFQLEAREIRR